MLSLPFRSKRTAAPAGWNMGDLQEGRISWREDWDPVIESHVRDPQLAFILSSPTDVKFIVDETLDFGGLSPSDRYQPLHPTHILPMMPLSLTPYC